MTITSTTKIRKALFLLTVLLSILKTSAQNLVPNGDFETHTGCPVYLGNINRGYTVFPWVSNWATPTYYGTPDYFNACADSSFISGPPIPVKVPDNLFGHRTPRSGNAYVGLIAYQASAFGYREYIENKLTTNLIAGHQYAVSFYASLSRYANVIDTGYVIAGVDGLALHFSDTLISHNNLGNPILDLSSDIVMPGHFITDTVNWTKVSGIYTAHGGERYIIIGQFKNISMPPPLAIVDKLGPGSVMDTASYLYVDDVCIKDLSYPDFVTSKDATPDCTVLPATLTLPPVASADYLWNTGDTTASITVSGYGTYWRRSIGDCVVYSDTLKVTNHVLSSYSVHPACYGLNNGYISVNAQNGISPYQFATGAGPFSARDTFDHLLPGIYTIHVKDSLGCARDTTLTIGQVPQIIPVASITNPRCYNDTNGSITIGTSGGVPPYTYIKDAGSPANFAAYINLKAQTTTIHIIDHYGCTKDTTITLTQPLPLKLISVNVVNLKCYNDSTGIVRLNVTGGTLPYFLSVNGGATQSSDTLGGLKAGSYSVHFTDNFGCSLDTSAIVTQPPMLIPHIDSFKNIACEGDKNGYFQIGASGGTFPYQYSLTDQSHYSPASIYTTQAEGNYLVYIKDAHGCIADTTLVYTPSHITINNVLLTNAACYNESNGEIIISAVGSTGITYTLDNNIVNNSGVFDGLKAQDYHISIGYSVGCNKDTSFTLTQPTEITATVTTTPDECEGKINSGSANVVVGGGNPPYTYLWRTPENQTDPAISGMPSGSFVLVIHDANYCVDSVIAAILYDNCCNTYLPNAFTPNGDGNNDVFRIKYRGDLKIEHFYIYNRYGQRVFITTDAEKGWDGQFNGAPQDAGTYYYTVKAVCGNQKDHEINLKGDVILVR